MADKRVSVVIPAYNEERNIATLLTELLKMGGFHEIIVVDDGSTDKTVEIVAGFDVTLIKHPYNIGNGGSVKTGLRAVTGDVVVLMDADGQHPVKYIPELLEHLTNFDLVVGARTSASQARIHRVVANRLFNFYASYIVGRRVHDLTSGFRALNYDRFRRFIDLLPNGYSYPSTMTIIFFRGGYTVKYHPFVSPAAVGKSKVRPIRDGMRFLLTITRLGVLFVPLRIFLPISLMLLTSGLGYVAWRIFTVHRFSGLGGMIATAGIIVFMLGLIAEQIALLSRIDHGSH